MALFPISLGIRPRLAVEVRPEGVVAARADEGSSQLAAASRVDLGRGASVPQLRAGSAAAGHSAPAEVAHTSLLPAERALLTAALRTSLESVAGRDRQTTLVVPDAAVRVLLLDFDALPTRAAEALPIVRFRLKKLVPFDTETAAISYQLMSAARGNMRVLAAAIPGDLLAEYESIVRDAGFEPGAVLPSTLATLAGLAEGDEPVLLVNAGAHAVTTAIARGNMLLLHRSVDLSGAPEPTHMPVPPDLEPAARSQTAALEREMGLAVQPEAGWELAQAVSVAAAYFEDTLQSSPGTLLTSGALSATAISELLAGAGVGPVAVREAADQTIFAANASTGGRIPPGWLAGVRGALAS